MHSKYYRCPSQYKGTVICVGYASSGVDITHELRKNGCNVYVAKKDITKQEELYTLQEGAVDYFSTVTSFISKPVDVFNKDGCSYVVTEHGNKVQCDHIIYCTGYCYEYPFFEPDTIMMHDKCVHPLYKHLVHLYYPSLAFVGLPYNVLPFLLFEAQAEYLASLWSRQVALPLFQVRYKKMLSTYSDAQGKNQFPNHVHKLSEGQWDYVMDLYAAAMKLSDKIISSIELIKEVFEDTAKNKERNPLGFRTVNYQIDFGRKVWKHK